MPTNKTKLPKGRVMFANHGDLELPCSFKVYPIKDTRESVAALQACAVTPTTSKPRAAALVRWHNKTEEQQVEEMAKKMWGLFGWPGMVPWSHCTTVIRDNYRLKARAILALWQPQPRNEAHRPSRGAA